MERLAAWFAPHIAAGTVADLPPALIEMLLIGPLAETSRRVFAGVPGLDLGRGGRASPRPDLAIAAPAIDGTCDAGYVHSN